VHPWEYLNVGMRFSGENSSHAKVYLLGRRVAIPFAKPRSPKIIPTADINGSMDKTRHAQHCYSKMMQQLRIIFFVILALASISSFRVEAKKSKSTPSDSKAVPKATDPETASFVEENPDYDGDEYDASVDHDEEEKDQGIKASKDAVNDALPKRQIPLESNGLCEEAQNPNNHCIGSDCLSQRNWEIPPQ
jgi:hypothetical protein